MQLLVAPVEGKTEYPAVGEGVIESGESASAADSAYGWDVTVNEMDPDDFPGVFSAEDRVVVYEYVIGIMKGIG